MINLGPFADYDVSHAGTRAEKSRPPDRKAGKNRRDGSRRISRKDGRSDPIDPATLIEVIEAMIPFCRGARGCRASPSPTMRPETMTYPIRYVDGRGGKDENFQQLLRARADRQLRGWRRLLGTWYCGDRDEEWRAQFQAEYVGPRAPVDRPRVTERTATRDDRLRTTVGGGATASRKRDQKEPAAPLIWRTILRRPLYHEAARAKGAGRELTWRTSRQEVNATGEVDIVPSAQVVDLSAPVRDHGLRPPNTT